MSNETLTTIIAIVQDLAYTVVFLVSAAACYFALQQPKAKQWLTGSSPLVRAVVFIVLTRLLSQALSPIVTDVFAFPKGLVYRDSGFASSAQCLGGLLMLVGLAVGAGLLAKQSGAPHDRA